MRELRRKNGYEKDTKPRSKGIGKESLKEGHNGVYIEKENYSSVESG